MASRIADPEQVVLESDPYRRLSYTWHTFTPELADAVGFDDDFAAGSPPSRGRRSTFDIEPAGDGMVKLTVVHDGFEPDSAVAQMVSDGWPQRVASLKTLLETGEPLPGLTREDQVEESVGSAVIDVAAMPDLHHEHQKRSVLDRVDDAVVTSANAPERRIASELCRLPVAEGRGPASRSRRSPAVWIGRSSLDSALAAAGSNRTLIRSQPDVLLRPAPRGWSAHRHGDEREPPARR